MNQLTTFKILATFCVCISFICTLPSSYKTLKDIIINRCNDFQKKYTNDHELALKKRINCNTLWNTFLNSFSGKDICQIKSYDELFKSIKLKPIKNKALFWSGTNYIAHNFTEIKKNFYTLEDTFPGYIANNWNWCVLLEIDNKKCKKNCGYKSNGEPYWKKASETFAASAEGTAYVMLNGNNPKKAVDPTSIFAQVEIPVLKKKSNIEQLVFFVVNDQNTKAQENCSKGSLKNLMINLKKEKKKTECYDNPKKSDILNATVSLICKLKPTAYDCTSNQYH
ncbi:ADP-ribosyl cyclase/cyclic ADP-ribose hydrolase-like [Hydra vulgaris]|uniref:ADP-ribosyl cyclase/cyclic ADP-ribose hydrolase-like n=1 Tax=Hydra vulgaris TaxID=6087 RepID=A0ABM4D787_HYDVU